MLRRIIAELTNEFFVVTWAITLFFAFTVIVLAWALLTLVNTVQQ